MQCRDFARQLAAATPEFEKRNTKLLIIGPGNKSDADRMARNVKAEPGQVLYDVEGTAYDTYMLDRAFFSLIQRSAAFIIDRQGVIRYGYVVANVLNWYRTDLEDLLKIIDAL